MSRTPAEISVHVTPAILVRSYGDLKAQLESVAGLVDWVQIDAEDGIYEQNKTWPYVNDGAGIFNKIVRQDEALPCWEDLNFEIDLMVADPVHESDKWIAAGAARLVIHIDSVEPGVFKGLIQGILDKGVEVILGFAIDSSLEKLGSCIEDARAADQEGKGIVGIQCMGIKKIGFQGQPFDPKVLENIHAIRSAYPDMPISVDGSVNFDTAERLVNAGASRLVIGSALFASEEPLEQLMNDFADLF